MTEIEEKYAMFVSHVRKIKHRDYSKLFGIKISMAEFIILSILHQLNNEKNDKVFVSDIANELGVTVQAVSRQLRLVSEKGYVIKMQDENDKRNTIISFTDKGNEALVICMNNIIKFHQEIIEKFDKDEVQKAMMITRAIETEVDARLKLMN